MLICLLFFALSISFYFVPNNAYAFSKINKVLFVTDSKESYNNILKAQVEIDADINEDLFEI